MPTVRLRDAGEYPEPIQKLFEVALALSVIHTRIGIRLQNAVKCRERCK